MQQEYYPEFEENWGLMEHMEGMFWGILEKWNVFTVAFNHIHGSWFGIIGSQINTVHYI